MTDSLAGSSPGANPRRLIGVVLAAGQGTRLRPLTLRRPKPLCPVGNIALVDHALERVVPVVDDVAVNVHHGRDQVEPHLLGWPGVHVSIEEEGALGTAGALGHLRDWADGCDALVVNGDTYCDYDLHDVVAGWDRERPRLVVHGDALFGPASRVIASLLPGRLVEELESVPSSLYERVWRPAAVDGTLDVVGRDGLFFDCGTPATYLAANVEVAERNGSPIVGADTTIDGTVESSVVGRDCVVEGSVRRSVLWDGVTVAGVEALDRAIRVSATMTVLVR